MPQKTSDALELVRQRTTMTQENWYCVARMFYVARTKLLTTYRSHPPYNKCVDWRKRSTRLSWNGRAKPLDNRVRGEV